MRVDIKDNYNRPIGYIDYKDKWAQGIHLRKGVVGKYDKSVNITFDKLGKIYCYGDGLQSLIRDANNN